MFMLKQVAKRLGLAVFCVLILSQNASAILMNSWALDAQYQANGNKSVGWIAEQHSDSISHGSLIHLNSEWGLTAAHVAASFDSAIGIEVGFGNDLFNNPGQTRIIDYWVTFPDWNGTFLTHDIALVHYSEPLYDGVPTVTLATSAPAIGDVLNHTGYGTPGVYGSNGVYDGTRRGFDSTADKFGDAHKGVGDNYVASLWRRPIHGGLPLGGRGNPGDSGGGVFGTADGLLYAIISAGSTLQPSYTTYTYSQGLWEESVQDWIFENAVETHHTPVPEPATLFLFGTGLCLIGRAAKAKRRVS